MYSIYIYIHINIYIYSNIRHNRYWLGVKALGFRVQGLRSKVGGLGFDIGLEA